MAENMVTNTSQVLHLAVPITRKGLTQMFLDPKIKKFQGKTRIDPVWVRCSFLNQSTPATDRVTIGLTPRGCGGCIPRKECNCEQSSQTKI